MVFGEENPIESEIPTPWSTWSDGLGGLPSVSGDLDWGKLQLELNDEGRSRVYDFGAVDILDMTLISNRYGIGQGEATFQYRYASTEFLQDDVSPSWITYIGITNITCRYIQFRIIKT